MLGLLCAGIYLRKGANEGGLALATALEALKLEQLCSDNWPCLLFEALRQEIIERRGKKLGLWVFYVWTGFVWVRCLGLVADMQYKI